MNKLRKKISTIQLARIIILNKKFYADGHKSSTSIQDVQKETKELMKTINSYGSDKKDQVLKESQEAIDKLDKRIDKLETQVDNNWDNMNKAAKKEARENLKTLRKQRNELAQWYGNMQTSTEDAWDVIKKGFSKSYQTIEKSWEKAKKEFENNKK